MTGTDDGDGTEAPEVLIGTPERNSAHEALEEHLIAKRLDSTEYERRVEASRLARTQSELLRLFADLPVPHPKLPVTVVPPAEPDQSVPPPVFFAGCLTLTLGLPVAVVLGFAYGVWWAIAVPVGVTVAMAYIEHLRIPSREVQETGPRSPEGI
ncbi:DUF1707 SHOCT-like domain-containing protein [Couchioplanes caeruleus]|uniref:DUF1707 domain-containing protein n=2 Tax=Couchioplanes caeruleus TaxID=56438 RepID=A0A1K0FMY6_9ACTN|nr:DUF1707 domain-containing protein [Couchioplanes caeruleus]OJF14088.1 hypothetical protein BG844_11680 [Couchioplanes caeruleus subsp. caeruleus]ROP28359.1 uncharacterized protein DUF1707 [Couchioplanes caeruleus]